MRKRSVKRWTALALTLVMALSLAVPAMGATPILEEVEAVVEIPAVEGVGTMSSHDHVDTPALDPSGEAEVFAASDDYVHDFTIKNSTTSSFYTIGLSLVDVPAKAAAKLTGDYAQYKKAVVLDAKDGSDISFVAPSDGTMKVTLVHPEGAKSFRWITNGDTKKPQKVAMPDCPCVWTAAVVKDSTYALGAENTNVHVLKLEFVPDVPSCDVHTWGPLSEDTATCTEPGEQTHTCTVCGDQETFETDPTGHTPAPFDKVDPTCADPGTAAGTKCSECGAVLTGGEPIPATGEHVDADNNGECDTCHKTMPTAHSHNFVTLVSNTATCTKAGVKTMACDWPDCDATQTEDVAALGHDWKNVTAKAATCTAVGWTAHQACTRCDAKENYTQFPALGHDFDPDTRACRNGCGAVMDTKGMNAGGWFEALYAEIDGVTDAQVAQVIYSGPVSGTLEDEDLEFLVRDSSKLASGKSGVRIDIPGIPAGTYSLLVVTTSGMPYSATGIEVMEHDRSGYAHYNYTDGVGAYRDDGILKDNAIVLYVTEETKNTVSVTAPDGTTVTGIGNILNSVGADNGSGKNSKGGKANTNQGILKKLADNDIPLVVRIVGRVRSEEITPTVEGLTAWDSADYGGTAGDNGNMARMQGAHNVTIEGIGTDATVDGWGFHFIRSSSDIGTSRGTGLEVRNITFRNVPEDCIGMEGQQESNTLTAPVERGWVHNCSFYGPKNIKYAGKESDKAEGDGACDFKRGQYFTMSYCYFEDCHKTNLVGSSDSSLQFHITWHHNYWVGCKARGPLGRQANMHIYNNIYEGQTDYAMNTRANCYIFSEYNAFINCKQPRLVEGGAIKSYNDSVTSCQKDTGPTEVTQKSAKVSSGNQYENFDTNDAICYIPSGDYKLDQSLAQAKANIMAYNGPMKAVVVTADEVDTSVVDQDMTPTAPITVPLNVSLNKDYTGTSDNVKIRQTGKGTGDALKLEGSVKGQDVVFMVAEADAPVDITVTDGNGTNPVTLLDAAGNSLLVGTGTVRNLPAGIYMIQSSLYDGGTGKFKDAAISGLSVTKTVLTSEDLHEHSYTVEVSRTEPTCTKEGIILKRCSAHADATITESIPKIDHVYEDGVCNMCGLRQGVYDPDAGGDTPTIPTIVAVTGITLDQESVYVDQDKTVTLIATVLPADATRKTVTWTSDDPSVATVSSNGLVTGKTSGTTTITATTKDGGFEATCTVKVIGITKTEKKFVANDYGPKPQVNKKDPAATEADKTAIETKTGGTFTLSKVAGTWKMTGDKTYYVTASKGSNALEFTVANPLNTVTISASSTGSSNYSVIALLNESGARVADKTGATVKALKGTSATAITFEDLPVGTYRIVSPEVASADVGGVTGYDGRGVGIHTVTITELQREDDDRVPVTSVALTGADTVEMGKSITLTATVLPADATTPKLKWTSSDTKVAIVSNGVVTGVKPGTATITAAATDGSGKKATKTITVKPGIVDQGNLGKTGEQVTWTLDSTGQLAITNTDNHIESDDSVLVALWGTGDKFLGVKLIRASQLTAAVGNSWDHLKLIWVNNKYAPKCDDVRVEHDQ